MVESLYSLINQIDTSKIQATQDKTVNQLYDEQVSGDLSLGKEYDDNYQKVVDEVSAAEFQIQKALQPAKSEDRTPQKQLKLVSDLKPLTLTEHHTPAELTQWMKKFTSYHSVSNLQITSTTDQQKVLLRMFRY